MNGTRVHRCAECGTPLSSCAWCTPEAHLCDECRVIFEDDLDACDAEAVEAIEQRRVQQVRKQIRKR